MDTVKTVEALSKLFDSEKAAEDIGTDVSRAARPTVRPPGPAGVGGVIPGVKVRAPKKDPKAIWDEEEVPDVIVDEMEDGRVKPEFDIFIKQAVGTHDVFLGLSMKDTSSSSCETLVVEVKLPGTKSQSEIDLDVQPTYLRATTSQYKLGTFLPHRVDKEHGRAEWNSETGVLRVSLPILREGMFA